MIQLPNFNSRVNVPLRSSGIKYSHVMYIMSREVSKTWVRFVTCKNSDRVFCGVNISNIHNPLSAESNWWIGWNAIERECSWVKCSCLEYGYSGILKVIGSLVWKFNVLAFCKFISHYFLIPFFSKSLLF